MFMFDIETLGIESTTVILSAAITHFDFGDRDMPSGKERYYDFFNRSLFVKFNAKEQLEKYNRTVTKSTLEWWSKQSENARRLALEPSTNDVSADVGIESLRDYIKKFNVNNQIIWARGTLDQTAIDSLCRNVGVEPLVNYNQWRDVRTAVDLLASDAKNGYCSIENFNPDIWVTKHDPRSDCALDIMMLLYHK